MTNNKIEFKAPEDLTEKTFRDLIYEHVDKNTWGSFGIDFALGSIFDQNALPNEYMFLPKYIYSFFGNTDYNGTTSLVKTSKTLIQKKSKASTSDFLLSPLFILSLLSLFIIYITYKDYKSNTRNKILDTVIFVLTSLVGIVIFLLWFATDHSATANNYNLLWAFPLNLILVKQALNTKMKSWVKGYLKFLIIMLTLMTLHWLIGVQVFAIGLIPILIALLIRYVYLVRSF